MTAIDQHTATRTTAVVDLNFVEFREAIATVGYAIDARPRLPVLGGVRVDIASDGVDLAGYDYDVSVRVHVAGAVTGFGAALVAHAECSQVLDALAKGKAKKDREKLTVQLGIDATGRVTLAADGTTVPITPLPLGDYPALPDVAATATTVDRPGFVDALKRVTVARCNDRNLTNWPMLAGVHLTATDDALRLECSDQFRLTRAHVPAPGAPEAIASLPPAHRLVELCKRFRSTHIHLGAIADDRRATSGETAGPPRLSMICGSVQVTIRTLAAEFPATERLMPTTETVHYSVTVSRSALRERSEAAAAVAKAKNVRAGELKLTPSETGLTIAPALPDEQDQVSVPETPATVTGTPERPVHVRSALLLAAVDNFTSGWVTLHFPQRPVDPFLVTETLDGLDRPEQYRHLLMPVRHRQG